MEDESELESSILSVGETFFKRNIDTDDFDINRQFNPDEWDVLDPLLRLMSYQREELSRTYRRDNKDGTSDIFDQGAFKHSKYSFIRLDNPIADEYIELRQYLPLTSTDVESAAVDGLVAGAVGGLIISGLAFGISRYIESFDPSVLWLALPPLVGGLIGYRKEKDNAQIRNILTDNAQREFNADYKDIVTTGKDAFRYALGLKEPTMVEIQNDFR